MSIKKYKILLIILLIIFSAGCAGKFVKEYGSRDIKPATDLYQSDNWEQRLEAIDKICSNPSSNAIELLLNAAAGDSHSIVRTEAIKCLAHNRENRAKKLLKQIAEFESNSDIRLTAIQSLAEYRDPTAAPLFAKGFDDEDPYIREESIKGLLMINDVLIQSISIPYAVKAINDENYNVRLSTLENLKIKDSRLYDALSSIINNEDNYKKISLLTASLKSLRGYVLDKKTRERVIEFLNHPNLDIRILALNILKQENYPR